MKLSNTGKITIGLLTILQLFTGLALIIWLFTAFFPAAVQASEAEMQALLLASLGGFIAGAVFLSLLWLGLLIFYIIHAGTNKEISAVMKFVWIILFLFIGAIIQVVYFFMEILPQSSMTAKLENQ